MFTPYPDPGLNPGPLDCKSDTLPTWLCWPLDINLFKDIYKLDVSNYIILMMKKVISHLKESESLNDFYSHNKSPDDHLNNVC